MPDAPSIKLKREIKKIIREIRAEKNITEGKKKSDTKLITVDSGKIG